MTVWSIYCLGYVGPVSVEVEGSPPAAPAAPTLTAGDGQLGVSWNAPADNGAAITDYDVRYKTTGASAWTNRPFSGAGTSTTITGLTNGTAYQVQVRAQNSEGESGWSASATGTPVASASPPATPAAPTLTAGDGQLGVSWSAPADNGAAITDYDVRYKTTGASAWTNRPFSGAGTSTTITGLTNGTAYRVQTRAQNSEGESDWSASATATAVDTDFDGVPTPVDPIVTEAATVVSPAEVAATDRVGTLAGNFRVDETGAATYDIPLTVLPGTAGVAPPLSLHYASNRGNGLLGVGWSLSGLSAISRCRQTLGQDKAALPITFSDTDRFCLDGQRLLLATGTYGAADSTYKTEIDSFATVTAKGGTAGHPDSFEVTRKDGSVAVYGGTAAAKHSAWSTAGTATEQVLTWALSQFQDSVGNPIDYTYTADAEGHRVSEINYAYGTGNTAQATLQFTYAARDDDTAGYLAGYVLTNSKRLSRIAVMAGTATVRSYRLGYDEAPYNPSADTLSRLTSVQECVLSTAGTADICLPATTFDWSLPDTAFSTTALSFTMNSEKKWVSVDFNPADINGDGVMDLVWTETKGSKHRIKYALAEEDVTTGQRQLKAATFTTLASYLEYDEDYHPKSWRGNRLRVHTAIIDYNGDGRMDIVVYGDDEGTSKVYVATPQTDSTWQLDGNGTQLFTARYRYADVNSDGLLDAYRLVENKDNNNVLEGYELEVRYLIKASDAEVTSATYYAYGSAVQRSVSFTPSGTSLGEPDLSLVDVNGDGRADLVLSGYAGSSGGLPSWRQRIEVFVQTDTGFDRYGETGGVPLYDPTAPPTQVVFTNVPEGVLSADLNRDGLADLVYFVGRWQYDADEKTYHWGGDWRYRLSTGTGFGAEVALVDTNESSVKADKSPSFYDYNQDGYPDFLWHDWALNRLKVKVWDPAQGGFESTDTTGTALRTGLDADEDYYFTLDVNGDGNADLAYYHEDTFETYLNEAAGRPNLITAISNGLGATTSISYEPLSTTDAYTRAAGVNTTTTTAEHCFSWQGSTQFCWPMTVASLDIASFYEALNDPFAGLNQPVTGTALAPVLELMGPLYVVTRVDGSAPVAVSTGN